MKRKNVDWLIKNESSKGLALGGGGARGCYEIGFWKAMDENGIHFDAVAGTSIGALVGAFYVQDSLQVMLDFVEHLEPVAIAKDLFAFPETLSTWIENRKEISSFLQKYIFSHTGMDISPLKTTIDSMFDYQAFQKSPTDFACMTYNLSTLKPVAYHKEDMNEKNASDVILASASCYPAFPVLEMNGEHYVDGGYADNVPIDLVAKYDCSHILAIDVEGPGVVKPIDSKLDVFMVKPILPLMNFLDFTSTSAMKNLHAGYYETLKLLQKRAGAIYTFDLKDQDLLDLINGYLRFCFDIEGIQIDFDRFDSIARSTLGSSKSNLSDTLFHRASYNLLVEALAYQLGIDAYQEWDAHNFLLELMNCFKAFELAKDQIGEMINQLAKRNISRVNAICLFQWILCREGSIAARNKLQTFAYIYPNEVILAWTWHFLEQLDHRTYGNDEVQDLDGGLTIEKQRIERAEDKIKNIEKIYFEQLEKIEKIFKNFESKNRMIQKK